MAKEATLQVRMDANMKEQVELLYRRMGTSFAEGVRMFAAQSLCDNAIPFSVHLPKKETGQRIGIASGEFLVPDDIDACNEEISALFGGV
ncbi:MAG: type II toxin-antitoxin system RelB/DinJ family antitoxin [Lachnospiraceae bacterium]|nr:type II toxin-antitoxin system RelB/DinJ family antitoxin [Lachnospiraceae bacterium]